LRHDTLFLSFFLRTPLILTHVKGTLPQAASRFLFVGGLALRPTLSKLALGVFVALWSRRWHAASLPAAQTFEVRGGCATSAPTSTGCSTCCATTSTPSSLLIRRLGWDGLFKFAQASFERVGSLVRLWRLVRLGRLGLCSSRDGLERYYVTSSYILCHIIIHTMPHCAAVGTGWRSRLCSATRSLPP